MAFLECISAVLRVDRKCANMVCIWGSAARLANFKTVKTLLLTFIPFEESFSSFSNEEGSLFVELLSIGFCKDCQFLVVELHSALTHHHLKHNLQVSDSI